MRVLIFTLVATALAGPAGASDTVVARVGDEEVTAARIVEAAQRTPPTEGEEPLAYRKRLLQPYIHRLLLAAEARRQGLFEHAGVRDELARVTRDRLIRPLLPRGAGAWEGITPAVMDSLEASARRDGHDRDPAFVAWRARKHEELAVTRLYEEKVAEPAVPDESEVRAYYDEHREDYRGPEMVLVDGWSFADTQSATHVEQALERGLPDALVNAMARDADPDTTQAVERELRRTLDSLRIALPEDRERPEIGEILVLTASGRPTWVYRVRGIEPGTLHPFSAVRDGIKDHLTATRAEQLFADLLDDLAGAVQIQIDEKALARLEF